MWAEKANVNDELCAGGVLGGESGDEGREKKSGDVGRWGACDCSEGAGERFAKGSSSSKSGGGEFRVEEALVEDGIWRGGR